MRFPMDDVSDSAIIGALHKVATPLIMELHRRGYDVLVDPDYVAHEVGKRNPQPLIIQERGPGTEQPPSSLN